MLEGKIRIIYITFLTNYHYLLRNPKDACVSFFHMDKLMPHHGMREDYDFEDYATNVYMKGKVVYGSYWEHLNVRQVT